MAELFSASLIELNRLDQKNSCAYLSPHYSTTWMSKRVSRFKF